MLDFSHLTVEERLELIGQIWDSLDTDKPSFSANQADLSTSGAHRTSSRFSDGSPTRS